MVTRLCCPECFDDRGLREDIFPTLAPQMGTCSFCGSEDVPLVEPKQLQTWFELLVNVYQPDERGKALVEWMEDDLQLFAHPKMDLAHAKELLSEILDDGDIVRQPFVFNQTSHAIDAAIAGQGIVLATRNFVASDLEGGRLVQVEGVKLRGSSDFYLVWPKHRKSAAMDAVRTWMISTADQRT